MLRRKKKHASTFLRLPGFRSRAHAASIDVNNNNNTLCIRIQTPACAMGGRGKQMLFGRKPQSKLVYGEPFEFSAGGGPGGASSASHAHHPHPPFQASVYYNFPWMVYSRLLQSPHRTLDPADADVFFVPAWGNGAGELATPCPDKEVLWQALRREVRARA